jgi:hypothetical protein
LAGMIAFTAYYWNFTATYDQREAEKAAAIQAAQQAQREDEARMRQKAVDDAYAAGERRKLEREAKAAKQRKEEDDKETASAERDKARHEVVRLRDKATSLEREVQETEDDLAKFNLDKSELQVEQASIEASVKLAEANTKKLADVLDKIAAADAANEAAAKAAAAAAKKD